MDPVERVDCGRDLFGIQMVPGVSRFLPRPTDLPEKDEPIFTATISIQGDVFGRGISLTSENTRENPSGGAKSAGCGMNGIFGD